MFPAPSYWPCALEVDKTALVPAKRLSGAQRQRERTVLDCRRTGVARGSAAADARITWGGSRSAPHNAAKAPPLSSNCILNKNRECLLAV